MLLIKKGQTFKNFKIMYRSSALMFAYKTYFTILLHSHKMILPSGKTKVKPSQFRTKAAAASFIQQHIDARCDAREHSLKSLQGKIQNYIESKKNIHKMQGSLGIVALDQNIQFSSICLGNGDMLIGASNLANTIYSITTDFVGVNAMCSYAEGWTNVNSLALSGDELAVCADGVLHVFVPSQRVTRIIKGSDGLPISSQAVNVAWFGKDILFCEEHSVKFFESGAVAVIAGHSKGNSDGSQSHSKLCQPIGICIDFDRNIYVTDSGSGTVKLINRNCRVPWKATSSGQGF